ncbi:MAG: pyridoxamine 5'-phosphate oxidase family protein [Acidobacteriaceae bacterium]
MSNPFHEGELEVQRLAGESQYATMNGAAVAGTIMLGALAFLEQQVIAAFTSEAEGGRLWTRILFGKPGFLRSPNARRLIVTKALLASDDGLLAALHTGAPVGAIVIDLSTRRRLRINGIVSQLDPDHLEIAVTESFGNCPKYITKRIVTVDDTAAAAFSAVPQRAALDAPALSSITAADLLFVGSIHPQRGADASHRGGTPGFVQIVDATTLRIPDYSGNSMFQTLGNFHQDARAAIAIPDFARKTVLHLSGTSSLTFDQRGDLASTGGTARWWTFTIEEWFTSPIPDGVHTELVEYSKYNP